MSYRLLYNIAISFVVVATGCLLTVPAVWAQQSSPNYTIEESFIGPGGQLDSSSANYEARATLGDTGIGNSASANYQIYGGATTTDEEYLEVDIPSSTIDFGVLDVTTAATGTATFSIRNYVSTGYRVYSYGTLASGAAEIDPMAAAAASSPGTEQFGLNLVANTSPATFGAAVSQFPDSSFSFGQAASGYDTANQFKYVEGETIAESLKSSGQSDYTMSYLINISSVTEAGIYVMPQLLVVTPTF